MKALQILLALAVNFVLWSVIILGCTQVSAEISQNVNISLADPSGVFIPGIWAWFADHWTYIALVASEVAALLPTKINGIVHGIVRMFNALFKTA